MQIRMLTTIPGSTDGLAVKVYDAGKEYDLSSTDGERSLAAAFVGANMAEEVKAEQKSVESPPAETKQSKRK